MKNEIASTGDKQLCVGGKGSETDLEFASTCADLPCGGVVQNSTCTDLPRGGMVQDSTCTNVTRGGTQGSTCAIFGISVQKIEEGDIHTIDGLGSSVMSSILSIDARTIILPPPCWRRKVTKPIRVLTDLFRISKCNHARMLCNIL